MDGRRNSVATVQERVNVIIDLILAGNERFQILQFTKNEKDWGVCDASIDSYIAKARTLLRKVAEINAEEELGKAKRRLEDLYGRSLVIKDYKACLAVQREIDALLGLNAPKEMSVSAGDGTEINIILKGSNGNE